MSVHDLNDGQLAILKLLYRYRYGSIDLLRSNLGMKQNSGLYQKLEVLISHGFIGKHYKKEYRLVGIPAAYHLLPKAYKALSKLDAYEIADKIIKASYRDNTRSTGFITHFMHTYKALNDFTRLYPTIKAFTQRDLIGYDSFPKNLPDGYLSLSTDDTPQRYFIDIIAEGTPRYVVDVLVSNYHNFFLEDTWSDTGSEPPALLILTDTSKAERYVRRLIKNKQDALDMVSPQFYTSTLSALANANAQTPIWTSVEDAEEPITLEQAR